MIAFLRGKLSSKEGQTIILEAGGIGWKMVLSREAFKKMPQPGREVKIWTFFHFRQDGSAEIYGFLNEEEEAFFESLNEVSGIGPKSALSLLDAAPIEKLKAAIVAGDEAFLKRIAGIGSKSAQRIIVELKQKFRVSRVTRDVLASDLEVVEALVNLGYSRSEAREALMHLPHSLRGTHARLRQALQLIGKKR